MLESLALIFLVSTIIWRKLLNKHTQKLRLGRSIMSNTEPERTVNTNKEAIWDSRKRDEWNFGYQEKIIVLWKEAEVIQRRLKITNKPSTTTEKLPKIIKNVTRDMRKGTPIVWSSC